MSNKLKITVGKLQYLLNYTVEQVAKSIDYSRVHLTKQMNKAADDDISEGLNKLLSEKHKDTLQNVSFELNDEEQVYITKRKSIQVNNIDTGKTIGHIIQDLVLIKASIKIFGMELSELKSKQNKTSFSSEALALEKTIALEVDRLFDEENKKLKQ